MAQSNDKYFNQKCPTNRNSFRSPKAPFDTQRVTNIAPSSFGARRPETRFCRETWVNVYSGSVASRGSVSKAGEWWVVAYRNGKIEE